MQTARLLQAVALMLIVALAASCAATKEYTSKIFPSKTEVKDSQAVALRFLDLDKLEPDQENWVSTDIIMGRDTGSKTAALDKLSEVFPATGIKKTSDTVPQTEIKQTVPVYVNSAPVPSSKTENKNVNKNASASVNKISTVKEEEKTPPVVVEKKAEPVTEVPVARNYGDTREKRSREDKP
jgi:hypothetical protein